MSHEFSLNEDGELEEVFVQNASVHTERMSETAFWIGIDVPGMPSLHINTGVHRGQWFFNVEEDAADGRFLAVQRPRRPKAKRVKSGGEK